MILRASLLLWPWPDNVHIRTWPVFAGDTHVQIWISYVKAFESYRLTDIHTYKQTDRHGQNYIPRRFADGQFTNTHKYRKLLICESTHLSYVQSLLVVVVSTSSPISQLNRRSVRSVRRSRALLLAYLQSAFRSPMMRMSSVSQSRSTAAWTATSASISSTAVSGSVWTPISTNCDWTATAAVTDRYMINFTLFLSENVRNKNKSGCSNAVVL